MKLLGDVGRAITEACQEQEHKDWFRLLTEDLERDPHPRLADLDGR